MKAKCISITKPEDRALNEDAVIAKDSVIAVADGAGGGGVFAEAWSHYLLENLPPSMFANFEELDAWVDGIWEPYYNQQETIAKHMNDPMLLKKFYDEGSFATLVAIWRSDNRLRWMSYGDSTAFCYNFTSGVLSFSCKSLSDFANAPYLISCKDPLQQEGFQSGEFDYSADNIYFVTSDALAHYIVMMYMVAHRERFDSELQNAINGHNKNANYIRMAMSLKTIDFRKVLMKLLNCVSHKHNMQLHLAKLRQSHFLAADDYSIAVMRVSPSIQQQISIF